MLRGYPDWWLFYDWEGDDVGYSSIGLTFKADGTFTSSDNWPGQWTQVEGMLIF